MTHCTDRAGSPASPLLETQVAPASLLCVEDDPVDREDLVALLKRHFPSLKVYEAQNGQEGLELYRKLQPDAVITDVSMPLRGGLSMAQQILALNPNAVIVAVSGHPEVHFLLEAINMGLRGYLLKPLDHKLFLESVTRCLSQVAREKEARQQQEEIERAHRLESLGLLAGQLAHDLNNILTGVLGNISFAQTLIGDRGPLREPLKEAEEAAYRAADLARQLLTFAHGGKPVRRETSVRHLVGEALSLALRGADISVTVRIPDGIDAVQADVGQIRQAFSNILLNANHALPGGEVTVTAENVTRSATGLTQPGKYVRITFADEGCGIPEEERQKVFEPFFSTKPGAPGLGLAATHCIVTRHGGDIAVESAPGQGTTITCHLPSTGRPFVESQKPSLAPLRKGKRGAVLLMDDESVVRKVTGKMLQCLGHSVITCNDGNQAVELFRQAMEAGAPFEAVIMDLTVVGGMGGKEAAQHILALYPAARLLVSSGYYDDPVLADYRDYGFCAVLPKPYKSCDLVELLGGLLSG